MMADFVYSCFSDGKNQTGWNSSLRFMTKLMVEEAQLALWMNSIEKSQATSICFSFHLPSLRFIWPVQVPAAVQDDRGMQTEMIAL